MQGDAVNVILESMGNERYKKEILDYIERHGIVDKDASGSGSISSDEVGNRKKSRTVDLHGNTRREADIILDRVMSECRRKGIKRIRIIHGRGFSSENGPVLKTHVRSRLSRSYGSWIKRVKQAPPSQGGTGVTVVILN